jgi:hypothetical protein
MSLAGCQGRNSQLPDHRCVSEERPNLHPLNSLTPPWQAPCEALSEICIHISDADLTDNPLLTPRERAASQDL